MMTIAATASRSEGSVRAPIFSGDAKGLVRSATVEDMAILTRICSRLVEASTATSEIRKPSEAEMIARRQTALNRGLPFLVAELDGYVMGFAYAAQFRPRDRYRLTVEDSIYLRPDCTG